jgi:23S rRNA (cytosine1962-C5)-methyltransferase
VNGQKTGFFIDQRDSRLLLGSYSKDRNVLNAFSYTGGFSLAALKGGASHVDSVDSSAKAMKILDKNIEINFGAIPNHKTHTSDVSNFLNEIENNIPDTRFSDYDMIILDPPAFGKHLNVLDNAIKGYRNLNKKAIERIKPNGILFTFSCSQVVSKDDFRTAVFSAAAMANRQVKVLHQLSQPPDHPVSIYHPEGEYLKGLVLFVE